MNLPKYITTLPPKKPWFCLSLTLAIICRILGIIPGFSNRYIVQDDARSHVFWMARFLNPKLFPNDIIADYFQSVAPKGYTYFYQLFSLIGIPPLLLNKFLPITLGLIATAYCFGVAIQILPVPLAGFLSTLFLNQNLWLKDDLISATPRAFFYPLFLGFLYYFLNSPNLEQVKKIIQKYDIDFWLLDSQALSLEYVRKNHRLQQLNNTAATLVRAQMENRIIPSFLNVQESCQVLDIQDLVLLEAKCILGMTYAN